MKFSTTALVLATLAVESASAASIKHAHRHAHEKKSAAPVDKRQWTPPPGYDPHWQPPAGYNPYADSSAAPAPAPAPAPAAQPSPSPQESSGGDNDGGAVSSALGDIQSLVSSAKLTVGNAKVKAGQNPTSNNGFAWLGTDGPWTNEMVNKADEDITLVMWGKNGGSAMFVQSNAPTLTVRIPKGQSITVSMVDGASGAYTAIYSDTDWATPGFLRGTIGEFTTGSSATFDVSREPGMHGHPMQIETPGCTSTMDDCVFQCKTFDEGDWCGSPNSYDLIVGKATNCRVGTFMGQPSGGCQGFTGPGKATTTFM